MYLFETEVQPECLWMLVLCLSILIPVALIGLEQLAGWMRPRLGSQVHGFFVLVLTTLFLLPAVREKTPALAFSLAVTGGVLFLAAYLYAKSIRSCVTMMVVGAVVFPAFFLYSLPLRDMKLKPPAPAEAPKQQATLTAHNPVPVVLLVYDAFCGTSILNEDREIDAVRYPNFGRLAREATWYRNASSVHPRTSKAVPAILTGRYPRGEKEATIVDYPTNLFTLLRATGEYEPIVFEVATRLFPRDWDSEEIAPGPLFEQWTKLLADVAIVIAHDLSPRDAFADSLPPIPRRWFSSLRDHTGVSKSKRNGLFAYGWSSARGKQFEHFLNCIEATDTPTLYFQHLSLPHFEWCYLPSGRAYLRDGGNFQPIGVDGTYEHWHDDDLAVAQAYQQYLLQVGCVDTMLGRVIQKLQLADLYDRCLFIVTADHGVSFRPDQMRREPEQGNLPDLMSVPLFVKLPHQRQGAVSDDNVETVDILPTICDVVGLDFPLEADGYSLRNFNPTVRTHKTFVTDQGPLMIDGAFEEKYSTLQLMLERFGSGDLEGLFRIGPHPELIGHRPQEFDLGSPTSLRVRIGTPGPVLDPELAPCYWRGVIDDSLSSAEPVELAFAVNGTIRAVSRDFLWESWTGKWRVMIPESALRPGNNTFQAYVIQTTPAGITLVPDAQVTFKNDDR